MLIQRAGYMNFLIEWKEQQIIAIDLRGCGQRATVRLTKSCTDMWRAG
ncbi:MAG: hypothetical protein HFG22_08620 [Lachnospiraceae bacterium]|nr:hypothetical protein [Lachnospiraceae bacterium]